MNHLLLESFCLNTVAPPCRSIHPFTVPPTTNRRKHQPRRRTHTHTHAHARARARARSVDPASAARDGYSLPAPRGRERPVGQFSTQDRTLVACVRHPNASGAQLHKQTPHTNTQLVLHPDARSRSRPSPSSRAADGSLEKDYILMTAIRVLLLSACAVHTLAFLQSGGLQTGRATAPVRSHAPAMATPELYLGIDAGTQSVKALL